MFSKRQIGSQAESLACDYLKNLGFKILERNYFIRGGEVDIIAKEGDILVFVEVKMRVGNKYGSALESITPFKIRALLKSARFYIQKIKWGEKPYRVDLVTIDYEEVGSKPKINLVKNITF